jgi:glyoxylase-like metal-dependent hydrolase (beta-lactamase superfamily II)
MKNNSYSFKIGKLMCLIINDGQVNLPEPDSQGNMTLIETMSLFINTGTNKILVDTGFGSGASMAPLAGHLTENLEEAGINREEIDTIIFSHAHVDHIGGTMDNKGKPVFPNARYYMSRNEWEFWTNDSNFNLIPDNIRQTMSMTVKKNLLPLKGIINLLDLDKETQIVPGVVGIPAPGHSTGQMALVVSSFADRLMCLFDVFHHPNEIQTPDMFMVPSTTEEAKRTRVKMLNMASKPGILVFAGHFPFPGLGHIIGSRDSYSWKPLLEGNLKD